MPTIEDLEEDYLDQLDQLDQKGTDGKLTADDKAKKDELRKNLEDIQNHRDLRALDTLRAKELKLERESGPDNDPRLQILKNQRKDLEDQLRDRGIDVSKGSSAGTAPDMVYLQNLAGGEAVTATPGAPAKVEFNGQLDTAKALAVLKLDSLVINYQPWMGRRRDLTHDRDKKKAALEKIGEEVKEAEEEYQKQLSEWQPLDEKFLSAKDRYHAAWDEFLTWRATDSKYLRLDKVFKQIGEDTKGWSSGKPSEKVQKDVLKNWERLRKEIEKYGEEKTKELKNKTDEAGKDYWPAREAAVKASTQLSLVAGKRDSRVREEQEAKSALGEAESKVLLLDDEDTPLLTRVLNDSFDVRLATPTEDIAGLLKELKELDDKMGTLFKERMSLRGELKQLMDDRELASAALITSREFAILAQTAVEMGFVLKDVVKRGVQAGPVGAAAEAVKILVEKSVELALTGQGASYYEDEGDFLDDAAAQLCNLPKTSAKRAVKSSTTGAFTKGFLERYKQLKLKQASAEETKEFFSKAWQKFQGSQIQGSPRLYGDQARQALADYDKVSKEIDRLKKWDFDRIWKEGTKELGKDFMKGLVKDVAKEAAKRFVANLFSTKGLAKRLVEIDFRLQLTAQNLVKTSNLYWNIFDLHEFKVALRDSLGRYFRPSEAIGAPSSWWVIEKNEKWYQKKGRDYEVRLHNVVGEETAKDIQLKVGGQKARKKGTRFAVADKRVKGIGHSNGLIEIWISAK